MIVIGIDPHMKTHTAVAVDAASGRTLAEKTVSSDARGHEELLLWARALGSERCFAVEDCRHVSGRLERHLLPRGERLVRVPPKLMARARSSARTYGKSDPIDAACVARAALREPGLPEAHLAGPEQDVRVLDRYVWLDRIAEALQAVSPDTRRRIALEQTRRCRELTAEIRALEREIRTMMRALAPELLTLPGCSALSAAQLVGQVAGASRFAGEAAFAMHVGTAPLPVSSGKSTRQRLNRCGNRRLNATIHMIAITQARMHPPAIAYMERKRAEGMSSREARRCLKRHITRMVFKTMLRSERARAGQVLQAKFGPEVLAVAV